MPWIFKSLKEIIILGSAKNGPKSLGKGSYAKVCLVHHAKNPKKLYAMKIVDKKNKKEI